MSATAVVPGKLYIAGEYAVVEPGRSAVLVAVNRMIRVHVEATQDPRADAAGTIVSALTGGNPIPWLRRAKHRVEVPEPHGESTSHVRAALEITERYINEQGFALSSIDLTITSEMDSESGVKLGLGSSGAVTVATVTAVLLHQNVPSTLELVYRLAMLATVQVDLRGSGGDVAAAVYGGWILYRSPNRQQLSRRLAEACTVTEVVREEWYGSEIQRLPSPRHHELMVGWTGGPASTAEQITRVHRTTHTPALDELYSHSNKCVHDLAAALRLGDGDGFVESVCDAGLVLEMLQECTGANIVTPTLRALVTCAADVGAVAKSSGAGGGDCGIAFTTSIHQRSSLFDAWHSNNIQFLDIDVYNKSIEV